MSDVERLLGSARDDLVQIDVRLLQQIEVGERNVRLQFELARQGAEAEERLSGRAVGGGVELATADGIRW